MNDNRYDINPTSSNINAYNRYPFSCYEEAVLNLMHKHLQPGEQAVAYFFDEHSLIGINAVFAFGNLKKAGNIIFKNGDQLDNQFEHINCAVSKQNAAINSVIDSINHANKNWSRIEGRVDILEKIFEKMKESNCIKMFDLDNYELDLK